MADYPSSVLKSLTEKLGHSLLEVREGALKTLKLKFDHGLLQAADAVQRKDLLEKLLDWFNKPHCSMESEVLSVLLMLSEHGSAVSLLNALGAVEFLSQLQRVLDEKHHAAIDSILQNLLLLQTSVQTSSAATVRVRQQRDERTDRRTSSSSCIDKSVESVTLPSGQSLGDSNRISGYHSSLSLSNSMHSVSIGETSVRLEINAKQVKLEGFIFPLISLAQNDVEILNSTFSRLHNRDETLLIKTCNFLVDVLFKDFPAETFLQRPVLCQGLFHLLSHASGAGNEAICIAVLNCLTNLTQQLHTRFILHTNPACCSRITTTHNEAECQSHLDLSCAKEASFLMCSAVTPEGQITLQEFSLQIIKAVCSIMKNQRLVLAVLRLLQADIELIHSLGSYTGSQVIGWVAEETLIKETLQELGDTLTHFLYRATGAESSEAQLVVSFHSKVCLSFVACLVLELTVPPCDSMSMMPLSLRECLAPLAMNEVVAVAFPGVRSRLLPYLAFIQPEQFSMLKDCIAVSKSFSLVCKITEQTTNKMDGGATESMMSDSLNLAEVAICGLLFHHRCDITEKILKICFTLYESEKVAENKERVMKLLLKLLAHPHHQVRLTSYKRCLSDLQKRLEDCQANGDGQCRKSVLLQQDVIMEICMFGLNDSCLEISLAAKALVILLFNQADKLECLRHIFLPVMPYIESHMGKDREFDHVVMRELNPVATQSLLASNTALFSKVQRVQGLCRLLFSVDFGIRGWALSAVCRLLHKCEPHEISGSPEVTQRDLFVSLRCQAMWQSKNAHRLGKFIEDGVMKVYCVLKNSDIDLALRKSAAEQLTVILEDPRLHECVVNSGIVGMLIDLSQTLTEKCGTAAKELNIALLPLSWKILYLLALYSKDVCDELSCSISLCSSIIKGSLGSVCQPELEVNVHAAHLLHVVLFGHISKDLWKCKVNKSEQEDCNRLLVLPPALKTRFHVPCQIDEGLSTNATPALRADERARQMLKIAYNIAKYDSAGQLLTANKEEQKEEDEELQLLDSDITLLRNVLPFSLASLTLEKLKSASTHNEAEQAVTMLTILMHSTLLEMTTRHNYDDADTSSNHSPSEFCKELLKCGVLDWKDAFERFLSVPPSSPDDQHLLSSVWFCLSLLITCMSHDHCRDCLEWLLPHAATQELSGIPSHSDSFFSEIASSYNMSATLDQPVAIVPGSEFAARTLQMGHGSFVMSALRQKRELRQCFIHLAPFEAIIAQWLIVILDGCDESNYSNMPVVERALECLVHITAIPNWSLSGSDDERASFCCKVGACLAKVVRIFEHGRVGIVSSFIGKGITKRAAICLSHLASEMARTSKQGDWTEAFLNVCKLDQTTSLNKQLAWLLAFFDDREQEVRFSAYAIFSLLCGHSAGAAAMLSISNDVSCNQWICNMALSCLRNSDEAAIVRQQAAYLLANLSRNESACEVIKCMIHQQTIQYLAREIASFDVSQFVIHCCMHQADCSNSYGNSRLSDDKQDDNVQVTHNVDIMSTRVSAHSSSSPSVSGLFSVVSDSTFSPGLIAAICLWFGNLIAASPQQTITRLIDDGIVHSLIKLVVHFPVETVNLLLRDLHVHRKPRVHSTISHLFDMLAKSLSLMRSIVTHHIRSCPHLLHSEALSAASQLWLINVKLSCDLTRNVYEQMIEALSGYVRVVIHFCQCLSSSENSLSYDFQTNWTSFTETLQCRMSKKRQPCQPVQQLALLADILSFMGQKQESSRSPHVDIEWIDGAALIKMLIAFGDTLTKHADSEKLAVLSAMKALLRVNHMAKRIALDNGFLQTTICELQEMETGLGTIRQKVRLSQTARKKQEEAHLQPAVLHMNILINLLIGSERAKEAAAEEGLANVVYSYWSYCLLYHKVMKSSLKLLITFTAGSSKACAALLHTSSQSGDGSLFNGVLKFACQLAGSAQRASSSGVQEHMVEEMQLLFTLLANCVLCHECLSSLWKSNLIAHFTTSGGGSKRGKMDDRRAMMWLKLLANLTFSREGQKMLLKVPGATHTLLDFAACKLHGVRAMAILVIRNICFTSHGRSFVLSDENCVGMLARVARGGDYKTEELSLSALNALLQSGHKVRSVLKQLNILEKAEEYKPKPISW